MRIDILTLFPEMFKGFLETSIIRRAIDSSKVSINLINFRDYTLDSHGKVDDTPFGGGAGMVLMVQPIYDAIMDIKTEDSHVILLSPGGRLFNQKEAKRLKNYKHLILICGHYEGFDDRIKAVIDEEISIGEFVLSGGELPAMVISDAVVRLVEGVISKDSLESESFDDNLLDYPVYTKPREFKGMKVPEVLLSGDHKRISDYRKKEQLRLTEERNKKMNLNQGGD